MGCLRFVVMRLSSIALVHIFLFRYKSDRLADLFAQTQGTILSLFNMFSGGALERMSIFALGIMPYISAAIVMQLLTAVVPSLEALKKMAKLDDVRLLNTRVMERYS